MHRRSTSGYGSGYLDTGGYGGSNVKERYNGAYHSHPIDDTHQQIDELSGMCRSLQSQLIETQIDLDAVKADRDSMIGEHTIHTIHTIHYTHYTLYTIHTIYY